MLQWQTNSLINFLHVCFNFGGILKGKERWNHSYYISMHATVCGEIQSLTGLPDNLCSGELFSERVNWKVFIVMALTISNFTSFPPCLAPGEGPWLWRGVRPEPLPLADGGPSAGSALGFDWLQTPCHPVMTSENPHRTLSLSPLLLSPKWQPAATEMMNAQWEALVTNKQKPVSPHILPVSPFDNFTFRGFSKWFYQVQGYKWRKKCLLEDISLKDKELNLRLSFISSLVPASWD